MYLILLQDAADVVGPLAEIHPLLGVIAVMGIAIAVWLSTMYIMERKRSNGLADKMIDNNTANIQTLSNLTNQVQRMNDMLITLQSRN